MEQNDQIRPVTAGQLPLQQYYDTELEEVPGDMQRLLEKYSRIPSDEVLPHIIEVVSLQSNSLERVANKYVEKSSVEGGKFHTLQKS
jgi:hypothetical protein